MVDVEEEAHRNAPLLRGQQRGQHERAGGALHADVVEREVERRAGACDECSHLARDVAGRLAAVRERRQLDGHAADSPARLAAL